MNRLIPLHEVQKVLLAELGAGDPRVLADLAELVGRSDRAGLVVVEGVLASLRTKGVAEQVPGVDGVLRWTCTAPVIRRS